MQDLLKDYPSIIEQKIAWGDMDAAQHINNTVYFRYFESGRIAYFDEIGFSDFDQIGPILAETSCRYRIPLIHPDTISIATRIQTDSFYEFGFVMEHVVVSHQHQQIAAKGTSRIVSYDYSKREKAPLPQVLKDKMLACERK
ncbi:acyl-CoA thioesterase [Microscilla marina]|uniref:Thioesterase superfamily n=1 Tax=Microscilla marina ATCC 23134 TaxID=313606 RepID=A1ZN61_MICM2|nr:acyl-CoA thioesterase [Microscilla marina]EAY28242.1 thioesterase superfamily [Microscilla marina ATCC 23134]